MDFSTYITINQFNSVFARYIVYDCPCYRVYTNFADLILAKRESYTCCVLLPETKANSKSIYKIVHRLLPIMLGSLIDIHIRTQQGIEEQCRALPAEQALYGSFLISGMMRILPSFITNNLRYGHVYQIKDKGPHASGQPRIKVNIYELNFQQINHSLKNRSVANVHNGKVMLRFSMDPRANFGTAGAECVVEDFGNNMRLALTPKVDYPDKRLKNRQKATELMQHAKRLAMDEIRKHGWLQLLKNNSKAKHTISQEDWLEFFCASIKYGPELDLLANKTVLTPVETLYRTITKCIEGGEDRLRHLKAMLLSGNFFWVLSSKNAYKLLQSFQCIYRMVDGQKLNLVNQLCPMVDRFVSTGTRNSTALLFPKDGYGYMCPINTRELTNAGELIYLTLFTITSPPVSDRRVIRVFKDLPRITEADVKAKTHYRIAWESFLTNHYLDKSPAVILKFKQDNPFLILRKYGEFLNILSEGHLVVKFSMRYKTFIAPSERDAFFPDAFDDVPIHYCLSTTLLRLPRSLTRAPVVKSVVSLQNIKGAAHVSQTPFDFVNFRYMIGTSSAALVDCSEQPQLTGDYFSGAFNFKPIRRDYYRMAELDGGAIRTLPQKMAEFFNTYQPKSIGRKPNNPIGDEDGLSLADILPNYSEVIKTIFACFDHLAPRFVMSYRPDGQKPTTIHRLDFRYNYYKDFCNNRMPEQLRAGSARDMPLDLYTYEKYPMSRAYSDFLNFDPHYKFHNHVVLYCGFGDIGGSTNEDGIILHSGFVEQSNVRKLQSITLNVSFIPLGVANSKNPAKEKAGQRNRYTKINRYFETENVIVFGILLSTEEMRVNRSRNIKVIKSTVGSAFRYVIYTQELSHQVKLVSSMYSPSITTVTINYSYLCKLGVGTKIANVHGQKGIVSRVDDLSKYQYWRRDGVQVHPQVLFSQVSIVGRTTSSQLYEMLTSPLVAFNGFGEFIAPISFNIHHIDAASKCVANNAKNDLMTSENGFLANELSYSSLYLGQQHYANDPLTSFHFVSQLFAMDGVLLETPQMQDDDVDEYLERESEKAK